VPGLIWHIVPNSGTARPRFVDQVKVGTVEPIVPFGLSGEMSLLDAVNATPGSQAVGVPDSQRELQRLDSEVVKEHL
jgi:hypothetical protein